jgi:hypothetical protein
MLTARRAFEGEDVSETLAAVLRSQPDLTRVPEQVRGLLAACLERDPRQRLRDIGDAPRLITEPAPSPRARRWSGPSHSVWGVALVMVALPIFRFAGASPDRPLIRLEVDLGGDIAAGTNNVLISRDGMRIVFLARGPASEDSRQTIATRRLDATGATSLPGTEGARLLFFSPDSQWVGFFADRKLKKVSLSRRNPETLCDAPTPSGASWSDDRYIVAAVDWNRGLVRLPDSGGAPQPLTEIKAGEVHTLPHVLPGAGAVIFTVGTSRFGSWSDASVEAVTVSARATPS